MCIAPTNIIRLSLPRQFNATRIPPDSVLRNTVSPYWHDRVNDEGVPQPNGFHALALSGKIEVFSSAYVTKFGQDGQSVILDDGSSIRASAVVLATGYHSSWLPMFDGKLLYSSALSSEFMSSGSQP